MAYSVKVARLCESGIPFGVPQIYEAASEMEAVAIAAYEVDAHRSNSRRIATVLNPAGRLVLTYAGRAREQSDAKRG